VDLIREWDKIPPASKHPLDIDFVSKPDGSLQLYFDGSLADTIRIPENPSEKVSSSTKLAKLVKVEFEGNNAAQIFAKTDRYAGIPKKYYPVELSANPRAKAFYDAVNPMAGFRKIAGVPYDVAQGKDSADIAICKQGMGCWALEVEEYLARSPFENLPCSVHFRVPAAPYSAAHIIAAIDPDPDKDKILTVRMSHYAGNGNGSNLVGDTIIDLKDGKIPQNFKQVGTLELKNGKKIPLYQFDVVLNLSKISDLAARKPYLDLDFVGKNGENTEQWDNTVKPDVRSDSAFNIFAVTLEQ